MLFLLEQDDKGFERKPIRCAHKIIRAVLKHIVNILMLIKHNLDLGRSTSKTSFFLGFLKMLFLFIAVHKY